MSQSANVENVARTLERINFLTRIYLTGQYTGPDGVVTTLTPAQLTTAYNNLKALLLNLSNSL